MGRPTKEELLEALAEAGRMREKGEDPHHVAKALLHEHYRLSYYEGLYSAIEHYLRSGHAEQAHSNLMKLLDKIRSEDRHPGLDTH